MKFSPEAPIGTFSGVPLGYPAGVHLGFPLIPKFPQGALLEVFPEILLKKLLC